MLAGDSRLAQQSQEQQETKHAGSFLVGGASFGKGSMPGPAPYPHPHGALSPESTAGLAT